MVRVAPQAAQPVEQFFQFSLLGLVASGYLSVLGSGYVDAPAAALAAAGILLRVLLVTGVLRWDLSRWSNAAALAYIGFYPLDYLYISGAFIPATVHLVFFLAVLRILTARTNRDYFFVKLIAFLELLAATLLSTNLNFFLFLTFFLIFGVATFACSEIRRAAQQQIRFLGRPPHFHLRLAALTASTTAGILLMTAVLFFLLPRTARAAFRTVISQRYHLPGFSNEVTLGQIGEIKRHSAPVMHVQVETPNERLAFKWRGTSLSHFDGKRWYNPPAKAEVLRVDRDATWLLAPSTIPRRGRRVRYEVRMDAVDTDTIFVAGTPEYIQIKAASIFRSSGGGLRIAAGFNEGARYSSGAFSEYSDASPPMSSKDRASHLALPELDPRIADLSQTLGKGQTSEQSAKAIELHLRSRYGYTIDLLSEPVADPLAHFLFERRQGHCEYFASAMAVMLRELQIPSRVVTGFESGVYNPLTGFHAIRASDAHSWVEAYLPGAGWTTFDPTPPAGRGSAVDTIAEKWELYLDAANMFWQQWVVNYDLERQFEIAAHVERSTRAMQTPFWADWPAQAKHQFNNWWSAARRFAAASLIAAVVLAVTIAFGPGLWRQFQSLRDVRRLEKGRVHASDASVLYARMLELLRRRGFDKPAWLTPAEFARVLPPSPASIVVEQLTSAYQELRYAGRPEAGLEMMRLLKVLESGR
ncbi:MAG: DUF3488 and transglutaminase-like domain-containing protein [Bryobacteraceae bacterium]